MRPLVPLLLLVASVLAACGGGGESPYLEGAALDDALKAAVAAADADQVAPGDIPAEDPVLVELGRLLFFDKILSGNLTISCATCHHPLTGTGDDLPVSIGEGGSGLGLDRELGDAHLIPRNAPPLFNLGHPTMTSMFWDSRVTQDVQTGALSTPEPGLNGTTPPMADHAAPLATALAAQAMFPVTSREEMRGAAGTNEIADAPDNAGVWAALMARLVGTQNGTVGGIQGYRDLFAAAFPSITSYDDLTFGHAARAIAAYEREVFAALETPFDRYLAGDDDALTWEEKQGAMLFFGRAGCADCHGGPLLTDLDHHALAVPQVGPGKVEPSEDRGLALQTGSAADDYRFRTPPLRNVALSGPWMHDGAYMTLEGAVLHHLDCARGLRSYDASQLPELFRDTVDRDLLRNRARLAAIDPTMEDAAGLHGHEIDWLLAFLERGLTDPRSVDQSDDVPASVPSGLPVAD